MKPSTSPDALARIAFVTRRFGDLQGFRSVSLGAGLVVCAVGSMVMPADFVNPFIYIVLPAQMLLLLAGPRVDRRYQQWFGRVATGTGRSLNSTGPLWTMPGGAGPFVVLMGLLADMFKGLEHPGGVSFGAIALTAYSFAVIVRDGSQRLYYSIGVASGLIAIVVSSSVPALPLSSSFRVDPVVAGYYTLTYAVIGLALIAVGLLDHRLLATAMSRPADASVSVRPDRDAARLRLIGSAAALAVIVLYIGFVGWPQNPVSIYMALYLWMIGLMVLGSACGMWTALVDRSSAYSELTRTREARLLAQVAAMRGIAPESRIEAPAETQAIPPADLAGHLLLPLAMACGSVIDVTLSPGGMPSLLALSLAASHLRIAVRDWPARRHYLLGVVAASVSAAHYMFVDRFQPLDWAVWFLILASAAMLVEGLLDLRLSRDPGLKETGESHVDAI